MPEPRILQVILLITVAVCPGCGESRVAMENGQDARLLRALREDPGLAEMRLMQLADPQHAVTSALARHDKQFLALRGLGTVTPGVNNEELVEHFGYRVISGTTDIVTEEVSRLQRNARAYAEAYNKELLSQLTSETGLP